ncbi:MAG: MFS transporter [Candidatus Latescibacterota bacterium]|nr:MFS transporter [Candidatus Latescibacterota bacterium]
MKESHDPYSALRFPSFLRYLVASSIVRMGTAAQGLAIGWEVYERTSQALALGMVGLVQAIPMLLFTLPAGYLADVFDRRKLMMLSLAGATLTSLGLAAFSWYRLDVVWMYLLLFLDATLLRLGSPAQRAITPLLVPDKHFENAAKWSTSVFQITSILGPALGGMIIALNIQAAYILSAFSSAAFIAFLSTMSLPPAPRIARGDMYVQIAAGVRYVRDHKLLLGAISLDLFAVLLGGAVYLLPIFAKEIIDLDPTGLGPMQALGWLRAAPAVGACATALLVAHLPPIQRAGKTLLCCVAGFGAATIVFGLSENFWLSMVMLGLTGAFDNVSMVIRRVISQMSVPNEMRGRVQAVTAIFVGSSNEIGGFESGLVAQIFTPVISVVSGGIGTLVVIAAWTGLFPSLRRLGSLSSLTTGSPKPRGSG